MNGRKRIGISGRLAGPVGRWVVLAAWIAAALLLNTIWPGVGEREDNGAANLGGGYPSVRAAALSEREFPAGEGQTALLVWQRAGGLGAADLDGLSRLTESLEAEPLPEQTGVLPLDRLPEAARQALLSEDGSTLVLPLTFGEAADTEALKESAAQLETRAASLLGGGDPFVAPTGTDELSVRLTGPVGIAIDGGKLFENADVSLLIATVVLVLAILLLIYRSPILALIPIVAVGFAYLVVSPILGTMADRGWITADSQGISIMTVLLFGAGTDYCLFLITRFRQALTEHRDKRAALKDAISGSSGAIAMSGLTVVLSLFTLLLAQYGAYHRFAVPFGLAILVMGIASLTLVPALLAIFGRVSFFPFVPRTPEMEDARARRRGKPVRRRAKKTGAIGTLVTTRPWTVVIAALIVLGGLAAASSQIRFTYDLLSAFPSDMPSVEGFDAIAEGFSPGELAPVQVMADTEGKETELASSLSALDFVDEVEQPQQGVENPNIELYGVRLNVNPYSNEAMDRIAELRETTEQALNGAGVADAPQKVWIGGQTAAQADTRTATERDTDIVIPVVIGLIALLLLLYLRSIVATIYLIATVVLSYFSALGLGWLILHGVMGQEAIQGAIPLYAFVFLVALGEDYNIFMISSIWAKSRRLPLKDAIREGVGETGTVITSAGVILAGTFAVLATLPIQVLVQFGVVAALGVLLDTFIVRPFLVPAITMLLGRAAFWPGRAPAGGGEAQRDDTHPA
ncbi:MMPL family transporter [Saccharibacillus sp. CPCC 101409]|uniref:MMPL family transporter n=1 Tax=Saccharibacillus sp. CPCC 101409 TaxID=3058041 RepID=UPI002672EB49|nr:MMPL family transporter [Saccharibacillus sp. CPCC 101409]MDO3410116.1 MMPL family transporter [Saccharibacillus sp. CPCC 101409]